MNFEIWKEDFFWVRTFQEQQKVVQRIKKSEVLAEVIYFLLKLIFDYDFESDEIVVVCVVIVEKQKIILVNKIMVIVSVFGIVETVIEKEDGVVLLDGFVFIKVR